MQGNPCSTFELPFSITASYVVSSITDQLLIYFELNLIFKTLLIFQNPASRYPRGTHVRKTSTTLACICSKIKTYYQSTSSPPQNQWRNLSTAPAECDSFVLNFSLPMRRMPFSQKSKAGMGQPARFVKDFPKESLKYLPQTFFQALRNELMKAFPMEAAQELVNGFSKELLMEFPKEFQRYSHRYFQRYL